MPLLLLVLVELPLDVELLVLAEVEALVLLEVEALVDELVEVEVAPKLLEVTIPLDVLVELPPVEVDPPLELDVVDTPPVLVEAVKMALLLDPPKKPPLKKPPPKPLPKPPLPPITVTPPPPVLPAMGGSGGSGMGIAEPG